MTKAIVTAALTLVGGIAALGAAGVSAFDLRDRHECAGAERLADAGLLEKARKEYGALLDKDPERGCAKRGYVDVVARECDAATARLRAGDVTRAEAAYDRINSEPRNLRPRLSRCNPRARMRSAALGACGIVEKLADVGRVADAQTGFTGVLKTHPRADCALAGLRRMAELRCSAAEALTAAGLVAEAKAAYAKILESDVTDCAVQGLADLGRGT